jgi:hypothetical protein
MFSLSRPLNRRFISHSNSSQMDSLQRCKVSCPLSKWSIVQKQGDFDALFVNIQEILGILVEVSREKD